MPYESDYTGHAETINILRIIRYIHDKYYFVYINDYTLKRISVFYFI